MLTPLNLEVKTQIIDYCKERFGLATNIFSDYKWYTGSKNRIFIGPEEIGRINPESIGICIFRLNKTPKPTTNFLQLFGNDIYNSIPTEDREEMMEILTSFHWVLSKNLLRSR